MSDPSADDTDDGPPLYYDPSAPAPYWRRDLELAVICITHAFTLAIIAARVTTQYKRFKRIRKGEAWLAVAGIILIFPLWVSQIGMNRYGSGLHAWNVPDEWLEPYWEFSWGWLAYYFVVSMIKVSVCYSLLEILPSSFRGFRFLVYSLCAIIMAFGTANALIWLFQCQPFMSNFDYDVETTSCVNIDITRFVWAGVSVAIDVLLIWIPIAILKRTRLHKHEKVVLMLVFGANILGSIATAMSCYAIWLNRESNAAADLTYTETPLVVCNNIEILFYTIGGSLTVLSRFFIKRAAACSHGTQSKSKTPSGGFSKIPEALRKISNSASGSRAQRQESKVPSSNVSTLPAAHSGDIELQDLQEQQFDALHAAPALAAESNTWQTWETSYGITVRRNLSPSCIDSIGVLPDIETPPPEDWQGRNERGLGGDTMWLDSVREPSEEDVPPPEPFSPIHHTKATNGQNGH